MSICAHYDCGVDIKSFCCQEFFPCRICHDVLKNEEEKDPKKRHQINRYEIPEVRCRVCKCIQPPEASCTNCGVLFGKYFCQVCRLYENNENKNIFHCEGCNICRIGPREKYFHCYGCGACLAAGTKDTHLCRADATKQDCPICLENLFFSRDNPSPLKCGHYVHSSCYGNMLKENILTCPLCCKYAFGGVRGITEEIDKAIEETKMPEEFNGVVVTILCNECGVKSEVDFHFYGLKCKACGVYNTKRL